MTYLLCKRLIEKGKIVGLKDKMDVFLLSDRLTEEEYRELTLMIQELE